MKKFTSNLKLFLLLAAMVAGVSDAWGRTAQLASTSSSNDQTLRTRSFRSDAADGVVFNVDLYYYYTGGFFGAGAKQYFYLPKNTTATITWSGVPSGKNIRITSVTVNANAQGSKKSWDIYTSVSGSGTKSSKSGSSFQDNTINTDAYLKNIGNNGSVTLSHGDTEMQIKTITINYELTATYYFEAEAHSGASGSASVSFPGGVTKTSVYKENSENSASITATFVANPDPECVFVGWYTSQAAADAKGVDGRESEIATYNKAMTSSKTDINNPEKCVLYAAFSQSYNPDFTSVADLSLLVGETKTYSEETFKHTSTTFPVSFTSGAKFYYTIDQQTISTTITSGSSAPTEVISFDGQTITALNAGVAKITYHQLKDDEKSIKEGNKQITITVTKNENPISLTIDGNTATTFDIPFGNKKELTIASANDATAPAFVVATESGDAAMYSEETGRHYISAGVNAGDASWTVTQVEDYKYKQGSATFSVHVGAAAEATDCYVLNDTEEHSFSTGLTDIGGHPDTPIKINGPAKQLFFDAKCNGINNFHAEYSSDNGNTWTSVAAPDLSDSYQTFGPYNLPENTTHIRFNAYVGATLKKWYKNVRVTRKTYLNASDVTINKTSGNNPVCPGDQGVGTLVINHSIANGGDLKITWDNAKFTINGKTNAEGVTLGDVDCKTDICELPILFNADAPGTEVAHVTIYNNVYNATATITGEAVKRTQDFDWHIDNTVSIGFTIATADAFTSTRSPYAGVTYTFSNTAIMDIEDGNIVAKAAGDVTITAHVDGGAEYQDLNETKTVTVTEDLVQSITWTQSLLGLKLGDPDLPLTATATSDVPGCTTNGNRLITYESANEGVVKVINGNQLQIVGLGTTQVTARQAGGVDADGHTYVAVEVEKKVVVKDPSAPCEAFVYEQTDNWEGDLGWNAVSSETKTVEFDFEGNEPGEYTLEYSGKPHTVAIQYYDGALYIDEYYDGAWHEVQSLGKPTVGVYATATHTLNRKATKMRVRADGKTGYYYAKDCQVTLARYIELQDAGNVVSTLAFSTKCGASQSKDVAIHYSNLTDNLNFTLPADCPFSVDKTSMEASCGDKGTLNLKITYTPMAPETDAVYDLTISDGTTTTVVALHASATITDRVLSWEQVPADVYTVETVDFTAVAQTTLGDAAGSVAYSVASSDPADMAVIVGNQMSFTKAGQVTIEAAAVPDTRYTTPAFVSKTWTVVKTPTAVTTLPTITSAPLVAGADVAALTFDPGVAQNTVNAEEVSGTFTITSTGLLVSGTNTVWFEFTPDDTDMYLPTTASVDIEVFDAFVFEGNSGTSEEWGTNTNWNTGYAPTAADNVIIAADVVITGDINVNSLTINEGVQVTVEVTGKLTVGDGDSEDQAAYGDLIIKAGGQVVLSGADVKVRNFYINTELGDDTHAGASSSSQLDGSTHLEVLGDAFIDIKMDPSGSISYGFYDFVLPFPCDAKTGVSYIDATGAEHPMVLNRDYAFSAFSEATRATGAYAWGRFNGVLEAGLAYSITLDDDYKDRNLIRFRKTAVGAINTSNTTALQVSDGNDMDKGWNGIGNATLSYADLRSAGVPTVQVYNHATNSYSPVAINAFTYVVGSSFFVQVASEQDMTFVRRNNPSVLRAPSRAADEANEQFMIEFAAEQSDYTADRLYLSADEDALSTYEIGRDLLKFGNPTEAKKAQISGLGYGKNLCQMHFPMLNNEAIFPLSLFAPAAGEYVLRAAEVVDGQDLYLLENGVPVWNLSDGEYILSLNKGTNTDYSLAIRANAPAVPTDADAVASDSDVEKIIINGALFVRKNGMIFDAMGNRVK